MLPSVLSEQLCSLNPGVDRLAFSVVFKVNRDGTVGHRHSSCTPFEDQQMTPQLMPLHII